jgi:peptide/nickel transport system permease protein
LSTPDLLRGGDLGLVTRRRRLDPIVAIAFAVLGVALIAAVFGELVAPQDPDASELTQVAVGPSSSHWFGTDDLGRDVFSRVIVGARTALIGPILISVGALVIGNVLGSLAGYKGGGVDSVIMRWVDLMSSIPALLVAIVVAGVLGGGYVLAVALLTVLTAPYDTRIIRGAVLEQRARPYVEAARTSGMSERRVIFRHVWPNVVPYALANAFLTFAFSIVALSSLSFLGLGVGPGTADWGRMLSENQSILFENPMAVLAPALCIVGVAASMNLIGDWVAERLADRGRRR